MFGDFFDRGAEFRVSQGTRPHWDQSGTITFVTFRTRDSIPKPVLQQWSEEKDDWFWRRGHSKNLNWPENLKQASDSERQAFNKCFNRRREEFLDSCHGRCLLRRPELANIVANSLLHFDGERYRMGDFVIMPNHVHALVSLANGFDLRKQLDSWLHFTAREINKVTGETGRFWQQEPFDHLVRNEAQYESLREYIADNPKKAGLKEGEYLYRRLE